MILDRKDEVLTYSLEQVIILERNTIADIQRRSLYFGMSKFVLFHNFTEVFHLNAKMIINVCGDCLSLRFGSLR